TVNGGVLVAGTTSLTSGAITVNNGAGMKVYATTTESANLTLANAVTFASGAKLLVDLGGLALEDKMTLDIISSTAAIAFGNTTSGTIENTWFEVSGAAGWNPSTFTWEIVNKNAANILTLTIPEPSMFGLLAGFGALALVGARRRRKA
nr:PEP-CTERM sorting domain-containing protein [Opitutales bacterium]